MIFGELGRADVADLVAAMVFRWSQSSLYQVHSRTKSIFETIQRRIQTPHRKASLALTPNHSKSLISDIEFCLLRLTAVSLRDISKDLPSAKEFYLIRNLGGGLRSFGSERSQRSKESCQLEVSILWGNEMAFSS